MSEPFVFTPEQRVQIMQTALLTARPQKVQDTSGAIIELPLSTTDIAEQVERIAFYMSPGSLVSSAIDNVQRKFEKVDSWKFITGTLIHVDLEISSGRAIFVTKTTSNEHNNMTGQEIVRTGPTKWDPIAKNLASNAARRIGEQVTMRVAVEVMDNNRKARVVHDVQFRGPDANFQPEPIRWDVLGGNGKAFNTGNLATFQQVPQAA